MSNVGARDAQKISESYTGKKMQPDISRFPLGLAFSPLSKTHDILLTS